MSFCGDQKKMYIFHLVILVASLLLLLWHGYDILTNKKINYRGLTANFIIAVLMIIQIRDRKKKIK
jgi:hypothetical protein